MSKSIEQRWKECCDQVQDTLNRLSENGVSLRGESEDQLKDLIDSKPPTTESELDNAIAKSERLLDNYRQPMAYEQSPNHEPIPMPTSSMAEQAEDARQSIPE